ncbi:triphosphoribosyl-dephospho-CoA synthase, partial [Acidilobus sp.]|uniref:triphosphoribosyl-dephospho-CoA synthase n=1 Tax=Acidilobus sp. TaxID=1872109 RepID=UPI003CFFED96
MTSSQAYECMVNASALSLGAILEPLAHPKPGAVTRVEGQKDKDIFDFALNHEAVERGALAACVKAAEGAGDPIAAGLEEYLRAVKGMGLRTNVGLGQALMIIPLASASPGRPGTKDLCRAASELVRRSTPRASEAYYELLRLFTPSHLGRYWGPLPDVSEGRPTVGLGEVLKAVDDITSQEVVNGYRLTQAAVEIMRKEVREGYERALVRAYSYLASTVHDSLLARSKGVRASLIATAEASLASNFELLDRMWRSRGWSLGSILDVLSAAAS